MNEDREEMILACQDFAKSLHKGLNNVTITMDQLGSFCIRVDTDLDKAYKCLSHELVSILIRIVVFGYSLDSDTLHDLKTIVDMETPVE